VFSLFRFSSSRIIGSAWLAYHPAGPLPPSRCACSHAFHTASVVLPPLGAPHRMHTAQLTLSLGRARRVVAGGPVAVALVQPPQYLLIEAAVRGRCRRRTTRHVPIAPAPEPAPVGGVRIGRSGRLHLESSAHPVADSSLWAGNDPAGGTLEYTKCLSMGGVQQSDLPVCRERGSWRCGPAAPPPTPTPEEVAQEAYEKLPIPVPVMHFGPDAGHVAVNFWTVLWVDNPSQITATATAGAVSVTATGGWVPSTNRVCSPDIIRSPVRYPRWARCRCRSPVRMGSRRLGWRRWC
jgi:hypothetical protein